MTVGEGLAVVAVEALAVVAAVVVVKAVAVAAAVVSAVVAAAVVKAASAAVVAAVAVVVGIDNPGRWRRFSRLAGSDPVGQSPLLKCRTRGSSLSCLLAFKG